MQTIYLKLQWKEPVCPDNKGHNCSEWGKKEETD